MAFLTDADYKAQIKDSILLHIIEQDQEARDVAELAAQAELTSYLSARYDTAAVFAATGTARNADVVMKMVDMVLYHLHSRISPDQVPELRRERYQAAIRWLEMVARQQINPALPEPADQSKEEIKGGSNPRRIHHY